MPRPKVRRLTVLLLKEDTEAFADALTNPDDLDRFDLRPAVGFDGAAFLKQPTSKRPWWLGYIQPAIADGLTPLESMSTAAVLFVSAASRVFAFTFGYGRSLLRPECLEFDFGLKVVLNTVDPDRLRSTDVKTLEELTIHTRRDTSRETSIESFGLDITRDMLRAATGQPRDQGLARKVTGSDSLVFTSQVEIDSLAEKCADLLEAYQGDAYKERFGWVDNFRPVRDPTTIDALNAELLRAVHSGDAEGLYLAPPEPIDWERVESFRYSTAPGQEFEDLDFTEYYGTVDEPDQLSFSDLKKTKVQVKWLDVGEAFDRWPVYNCIVFETRHDDALFALSAGQWYEADKYFVDDISTRAQHLCTGSIQLPDSTPGETEPHYNGRVSQNRTDIALLDGKLARCAGAATRVEVCDLFTGQRQFVHVKKRARSSTLSYVFTQGAVSGEAFFRDGEFRQDARTFVNDVQPGLAALIPLERPSPSEFEIVFGIIVPRPDNWPASLPFVTQVSLVHQSRRLQDLGYAVSLLRIDTS